MRPHLDRSGPPPHVIATRRRAFVSTILQSREIDGTLDNCESVQLAFSGDVHIEKCRVLSFSLRQRVSHKAEYGVSLNSVFRDLLGWTNRGNRYSIKGYGQHTGEHR